MDEGSTPEAAPSHRPNNDNELAGSLSAPPEEQFILDDELHDPGRIVRHIMVIGFHHKHGYQVDYCYPPLTPDGPMFSTPQRPITLPPSWKTLPLLCLPDGSHNYDSDAIYFTMADNLSHNEEEEQGEEEEDTNQSAAADYSPTARRRRRKEGIKTIFGTACYRQIHVEKLIHRTDDMTRMAVQKSVCVLSTQPLYGLIRSKLEMITHAYFEELDFSKVRILKLTYSNLNSLLSRESVRENATFLGLSARHLVTSFNNNMLVLFKAMLLEKKILFYKSPVKDLCSTIMSMCSLFNGLLECGGLDYSTCDLQLSASLLEALKLEPSSPASNIEHEQSAAAAAHRRESRVFFSPQKEQVVIINDDCDSASTAAAHDEASEAGEAQSKADKDEYLINSEKQSESAQADTSDFEVINQSAVDSTEAIDTSLDETIVEDQHAHKLCQLKPQECGLPLQIFTRGSFCLPYLSISYLDLLSDTRVRSFVIGATNFLFKQRRDMYDVVVDMEENTLIINDAHLKRLLNLTVEDLRFMDYLSKNVRAERANEPASDQFEPLNVDDITKWVGGDEWIRYHFKIYTLYLLKAAKWQPASSSAAPNKQSVHSADHQQSQQPQLALAQFVDSFNAGFVSAWKHNTNNYRIWDSLNKSALLDGLQSRHPFSSPSARAINFSDMKLKLSYAVNSSEKGRLVSQTLNGIGKWSIWNNIASASNMAASTIGSTLATSAASAHSALVASLSQQQQQASARDNATNEMSQDHQTPRPSPDADPTPGR